MRSLPLRPLNDTYYYITFKDFNVFSSPDQKGYLRYYQHIAFVVICKLFTLHPVKKRQAKKCQKVFFSLFVFGQFIFQAIVMIF
jgi:hypothetical protein